MRRLLILLLCLGTSVAQERRGVAEIIADHVRALGAVDDVRTLEAQTSVGGRRATDYWRLPNEWVSVVPAGKDRPPWRESFTREGAFLSAGFLERWRRDSELTRGGYYTMRAIAELFPLLAFRDARAQRALSVGRAPGHEVLFGLDDDQGMRAVYLLDERTHLLNEVRYERKDNRPIVTVRYQGHHRVDGVMLPRAIDAEYYMSFEDPKRLVLKLLKRPRTLGILGWKVNPDLGKVDFTPPGRGAGGGGGFERRVFRTGPDPYEVAAADLDGDGRTDYAAACEGGLWVHFGGAEATPVVVPLGRGHHRGLLVADFDVDGRPELITSSNAAPGQTFFFVAFDADRTPRTRSLIGAPRFVGDLESHDLDRDGLPDLAAVGVVSRDLQTKFGNGSGDFRLIGSRVPLDPKKKGRRGYGLALGDINGDGITDAVVADGLQVVVLQGEANLALKSQVRIPPQPDKEWRPVDVEIVDLDRDGDNDLIIARAHPQRDLPGDVLVALNQDGKLQVTKPIEAGARVETIATGHFNADRHLDVVATSFFTGEISFLYGDGKGALSAKPERFLSGRGTSRLAVADCDGDGRADVVAGNRLDDTIAVFLNRRDGVPRFRQEEFVHATVCAGPTKADFRLEGLASPYAFAGEFRLPRSIADPSGLAFLGGVANTQLVLVSDKRSALFRAVLDRAGNRLLVGPAVPLRGLEGERLDLEAITFDHWSGNLLLGCEADSSIVRATIFGHVLGRAKTRIESGGNDGIEGIALRRKKDGTPLLYVLKERNGTTLKQPVVHVYGLEEDPFRLVPRRTSLKLPVMVPDQNGAAALPDRLLVVSRFTRALLEIPWGDDDGFSKQGVQRAFFKTLTDDLLGLRGTGRNAMFGNVEGVAVDQRGDLFLLVDNNREVLGLAGKNRGPEGRLLWFRNLGKPQRRFRPVKVAALQILVPPGGAQAEKAARDLLRRARGGADFEALVRKHHRVQRGAPAVLRVTRTKRAGPGEFRLTDLPPALVRLLFNLEVGEIGLCEYHKDDSPNGWHIVKRIE